MVDEIIVKKVTRNKWDVLYKGQPLSFLFCHGSCDMLRREGGDEYHVCFSTERFHEDAKKLTNIGKYRFHQMHHCYKDELNFTHYFCEDDFSKIFESPPKEIYFTLHVVRTANPEAGLGLVDSLCVSAFSLLKRTIRMILGDKLNY